jgi:hypothetical protein
MMHSSNFRICATLLLLGFVISGLNGQNKPNLRENLGPTVNDQRDQIVPVFSVSGDTLFFSEDGSNGAYHPCFSVRDGRGGWTAKQPFVALDPNSDGSKYIFSALNGTTYLINGLFTKAPGKSESFFQQKGLSIAQTKQQPAQWKAIPFAWFDKMVNGRFANAFVHRPSKTLWLSFATQNTKDLYVCLPQNPQETDWKQIRWSDPQRLPDIINTAADETTPFVSKDGRTLYFTSNRSGGFGKEDIYVATRTGSSWLDWEAPKNMGFGVNSNQAELYFTLTPDDSEAIFVSYKYSSGAGDLFRFRMTPPETPAVAVKDTIAAAPPPAPVGLAVEKYKPNNIVFLLDHSTSMNTADRLPMMRASLETLVAQLRPIDMVTFYGFGDNVFPIHKADRVDNRDTLIQMIEGLKASSRSTQGSAAILEGYKAAESTFIKGGNNEIFIITDGLFDISPSVEMLIKRMPQLQLTVVVIAQTDGGDQLLKKFEAFPKVQTVKITDLERDKHLLLENIKRNAQRI